MKKLTVSAQQFIFSNIRINATHSTYPTRKLAIEDDKKAATGQQSSTQQKETLQKDTFK